MPKSAPYYMTIHIGDYLRKTPGLGPGTWEYHGIYCQLRLLAWNTPGCRLPTDRLWIVRHLGCTPEIFDKSVLPVLEKQFVRRRNWWYDPDLSTYQQAAISKSEKQSLRAKGLKINGSDSSRGSASSLLPSKKEQQHRKPVSVVGKKKTSRWASSHLSKK